MAYVYYRQNKHWTLAGQSSTLRRLFSFYSLKFSLVSLLAWYYVECNVVVQEVAQGKLNFTCHSHTSRCVRQIELFFNGNTGIEFKAKCLRVLSVSEPFYLYCRIAVHSTARILYYSRVTKLFLSTPWVVTRFRSIFFVSLTSVNFSALSILYWYCSILLFSYVVCWLLLAHYFLEMSC